MDDAKTTNGPKGAEPTGSDDEMKIMRLGEDIGDAGTSQPADSPEPAEDKKPAGAVAPAGAGKIAKFPFGLKITQQTWLIAATLIVVLVTLLIFSRATRSNKAIAERREERTVASLTLESLIAKCGPPAEDATKDLYPMVKRTMSYKSSGKGTLTFEFSRTAEEKSDWVFLSMSDENGASYGTPETQVATMACLK